MTINQLCDSLDKFIATSIMPKATQMEKLVLIGGSIFEIKKLDYKGMIRSFFNSEFLAESNIWKSSGEMNVDKVREFADAWLMTEGGRYVFPGYEYNTGFNTVHFFKGFVINEAFLNELFSFIEASAT